MQTLTPKLVTIGLPIYKRLGYLPHVLKILEVQDYPGIELIVSDNGMNKELVRELVEAHYSRPFRFRQNQTTVSIAQHFNQLLREATGEYFVLLCDDDEISPNYVSELVKSLDRHPEASVALARQVMINPDGVVVREFLDVMPSILSGADFIAATWHEYAYGMEMVATTLARTEKLRACGGYPDFCRGTGIDNAMMIKLCLNGWVALNSQCVFRWRLDDASYGWSVSAEDLAIASREFLNFLDEDPLIREFSKRDPVQWRRCKNYLERMTWDTYLGRWKTIYRSRLPWFPWVRAAFAMPWNPGYYRRVASCLSNALAGYVQSRMAIGTTEPDRASASSIPPGTR